MRKATQTEHVAERLRDCIRTGDYASGSFLPGERDLAEEFGVSRGTVATAMEALLAERLIEQIQGRGTRVLPLVNRLAHRAICVVHNLPMVVSGSPGEEVLILRGIMDRLRHLQLPHDDLAMYYLQSERIADIPNLIHLSEIGGLAEKYGAMLFVEATLLEEPILKFHQAGIPLVVANLEFPLDVPGMRVDHRKTTAQSVRLLAAMGHRRIAYFGRDPKAYFYAEAEEGYRSALEAAGIAFDEALFVRLPLRETSPMNTAHSAMQRLLQLPSRPTGVVAARDYIAHAVCDEVRNAGLAIGRDVSVIGFDNLSWDEADPILTTFREPCYEMGAAAVDMLVDRILDPQLPARQQELEAPLVIRRSVGTSPNHDGGAAAPLMASLQEPREKKR